MPMDSLTTVLGFRDLKLVKLKRQKSGWRSRVILSLERESCEQARPLEQRTSGGLWHLDYAQASSG